MTSQEFAATYTERFGAATSPREVVKRIATIPGFSIETCGEEIVKAFIQHKFQRLIDVESDPVRLDCLVNAERYLLEGE